MEENAQVKLVARHYDLEGHETKTEEIMTACFYEKNNCYYLMYQEGSQSGLEDTRTLLKIYHDHVILNRSGSCEQRQEFKRDILDICTYATPYGKFLIGVKPSTVDIAITSQGGEIFLEYDVEMEAEIVSHHQLFLEIMLKM